MPSTDAKFMHKNRVLRVTLAVALAQLAGAALAQEVAPVDKPPLAKGWQLETVATGVPQGWGMAWLPDGRMLVTSKGGTLHLLNGKTFQHVTMDGCRTCSRAGRAACSISWCTRGDKTESPRLHDDRQRHRCRNRTTLVCGVFDGKNVTGIRTLFKVGHDKSGGQHFGSRLLWLPDGTLADERGRWRQSAAAHRRPILAREQAQNLATHQGSILRLTDDGKPAPGNPLAAKGALPEIWSHGHRNVQGLALDPYPAACGPRNTGRTAAMS